MKRLRCLMLSMLLASQLASAQQVDFTGITGAASRGSEMQVAAARGLVAFAKTFESAGQGLPPGFPLSVRDGSALRHAKIGLGFQVYDVDASALTGKAALEDVARPTGIWRYEVLVQGYPVGLATVAKTAQGWQVVSFGGAGLARDIHDVAMHQAQRAGTRLRYIRVPQATADFIQVQQGTAPARFAPLQATRSLLQMQGAALVNGGLLEGNTLRAHLARAAATHASR